MKIVTLVENYLWENENKDLKTQHGLSLYIELEGINILFDTGQDNTFFENAKKLGIDLNRVDYLVLSHSHYDHVGGLRTFLDINKTSKIIVSKNIDERVYSKRLGFYKFIGIDQKLIDKYRDRFIFVDNFLQLEKNISFLTNTNFGGESLKGNAHLYKKSQGKYLLDDFNHEIIMVIEEKKDNLTVFTGCSHGGILNMVKSVEDIYPNKTITTLVGGFHLQNNITQKLGEPRERVMEIAKTLKKIPHIYTGHCTGREGFKVLQEILKGQISEFHTGKTISSK